MASSARDLKRRKALAWTAFWKLERLWKSSFIPISTKVKLFNTTCITVLLYAGCESWVISKDMENKINSFGTPWLSTIYILTETAPLIEKESGFGNCGSLLMCFACLKMSLSENLQCMFLLIGKGNPEDSEPCSPTIFIVLWEILIAC